MYSKKKKRKTFVEKLHSKYRLVIMKDDTFEEKISFRLSRFNVFAVVGTLIVLLIIGTTYIIAFTPLKEYIPGYADFDTRKTLRELIIRTDSLEQSIKQKDNYILSIRKMMLGEDSVGVENLNQIDQSKIKDINFAKSKDDSLLREEIETESKYSITYGLTNQNKSSISSFLFFAPVKGVVTDNFNAVEKHYGIDIAANQNEIIKSTLDGTIIFADWTSETGYCIAIQHQYNLISVYKHNSAILKKQGTFVKAGEPIAIIGNTGKLTTGLHLHFELWYNGRPVNPLDYISFN